MTKFDKTIELPVNDLKQRREMLEKELKKTVVKMVTMDIKKEIRDSFKDKGVTIKDVSWDFYPESDDEGGAYYYTEGLSITTVEDFDADEFKLEIEHYGTIYEESVQEIIRDILNESSSDLYEYDIYEIDFEEE